MNIFIYKNRRKLEPVSPLFIVAAFYFWKKSRTRRREDGKMATTRDSDTLTHTHTPTHRVRLTH